MTTPDDLITWGRQQLDDDERVARAAGGGVWTRECGHVGMDDELLPPSHELCTVVAGDDIHIYDEGGHDPAQAEHIARHDPARILAEVDAKRRLLDWLDEAERFMDHDDMSWHRLSGAVDVDQARRLLLLPFADREGYREEWRP